MTNIYAFDYENNRARIWNLSGVDQIVWSDVGGSGNYKILKPNHVTPYNEDWDFVYLNHWCGNPIIDDFENILGYEPQWVKLHAHPWIHTDYWPPANYVIVNTSRFSTIVTPVGVMIIYLEAYNVYPGTTNLYWAVPSYQNPGQNQVWPDPPYTTTGFIGDPITTAIPMQKPSWINPCGGAGVPIEIE